MISDTISVKNTLNSLKTDEVNIWVNTIKDKLQSLTVYKAFVLIDHTDKEI
jgi:hypothetical protein